MPLRPRERLAARRRRARLIGAALSICITAAAVGGLALVSHHDRFAIRDVSVRGAAALPAGDLQAAFDESLDGGFQLFSHRNIFLYPRQHITQELLRRFPRLESVTLSRESLLAQAVVLSVHEREARHSWCDAAGMCFLLDENGFVFAPRNTEAMSYRFQGGLIAEEPVGQTFLRGRLADVVALLDALKAAGFAATGARVENESDMTIPLEKGFYLKASFKTEPYKMVKNLELALSAEALRDKTAALEYVDLRFGNRVYYRFSGQVAEEGAESVESAEESISE